MLKLRTLVTLGAGLALALPASAGARPADVVIVNPPSNPANVQIHPSGNEVRVSSSVAAPVNTRETPPLFGASVGMTASNGAVLCEHFAIPDDRAVMLSSMIAGVTGPATPRVWLDFYAPENASWSLKQELEIPLRASQTSNFTWTGQLATGFPIYGGGAFEGGGVPTEVRGCIRAPASGTSTGNITITGTYLN